MGNNGPPAAWTNFKMLNCISKSHLPVPNVPQISVWTKKISTWGGGRFVGTQDIRDLTPPLLTVVTWANQREAWRLSLRQACRVAVVGTGDRLLFSGAKQISIHQTYWVLFEFWRDEQSTKSTASTYKNDGLTGETMRCEWPTSNHIVGRTRDTEFFATAASSLHRLHPTGQCISANVVRQDPNLTSIRVKRTWRSPTCNKVLWISRPERC